MNLKHNSPATKVTDTTNIFWVAAALCWQSAGCNYIGPTQTRPAFYWLQLHWGKYDILTEFRVCCSSVRMKQLQFLLSNNRGPEVFARKKTPTINCHQNDNYHDHHWDETLRTVPVASESIRFYISTYSARFTLAQGQPDNHFSLLGAEDYVGINFGQRGKWNDWVNGGHTSWVRPIRGFICQYPK